MIWCTIIFSNYTPERSWTQVIPVNNQAWNPGLWTQITHNHFYHLNFSLSSPPLFPFPLPSVFLKINTNFFFLRKKRRKTTDEEPGGNAQTINKGHQGRRKIASERIIQPHRNLLIFTNAPCLRPPLLWVLVYSVPAKANGDVSLGVWRGNFIMKFRNNQSTPLSSSQSYLTSLPHRGLLRREREQGSLWRAPMGFRLSRVWNLPGLNPER